ncbi:MAG: hypothetical protein ACXW3C_15915, partial [Pyrinomonadaceae bacterium]
SSRSTLDNISGASDISVSITLSSWFRKVGGVLFCLCAAFASSRLCVNCLPGQAAKPPGKPQSKRFRHDERIAKCRQEQ